MKSVIEHFRQTDAVMFGLSQIIPLQNLKTSEHYFTDLVENIVSQQLSDKAAKTIYSRVVGQFPVQYPTPELILKTPDEHFRSAGLSRSKTMYIKDLSGRVSDNQLNLMELPNLGDEEIISTLTAVKGIGPWTAEMFLIFSLGREDVFSFGDLGLKNAIERLYKKKNPTTKWLQVQSKLWSPYRSYASLLLWRSNDIGEADLENIYR